MKRFLVLMVILCVILSSAAFAREPDVIIFNVDINYLARMFECAQNGSEDALFMGSMYETQRNEKIEALNSEYEPTDFFTTYTDAVEINDAIETYIITSNGYTEEDLLLLSKIITAEAGSEWLSDDWKMCVGTVVLNRVASPEFPNTISEVIYQTGQYYGANSTYFKNLVPSDRCIDAAIRLLCGERLLPRSVVFQANFKQGSKIHTALYDKHLGWTYFCYSSHPELYEEVIETNVN